jgi:predicted metal-dependent hydrolase
MKFTVRGPSSVVRRSSLRLPKRHAALFIAFMHLDCTLCAMLYESCDSMQRTTDPPQAEQRTLRWSGRP